MVGKSKMKAPKRTGSTLHGTLSAAKRTLGSVQMLMASGLHRTSAGDLSAKVFQTCGSEIRAYLSVLLRNEALARQTYRDCWDDLECARLADVKRAPSRKAHLYLLARNIADYCRLFSDDYEEHGIDAVAWDAAPPVSIPGYGDILERFRNSIAESELEILELHHARGLDYREVAHVLGLRPHDAEQRIRSSTAWTSMVLDDLPSDAPPLEEIIRDAFRVMPPPADEEDPIAVAAPPGLPSGTVINQRFTLEEKVGGGAFGWVYRATDIHVPGHVVALKMLHKPARSQAAREGAIRELSVIASAFHPSLVQFKAHGWFQDRLWFVMPWYDGETLQQRIDREPLSPSEAFALFEPVTRSLAAIHAAGIRHQDIKPDNIFLAAIRTGLSIGPSDVLPILLDLGVAAPEGDMAVAGTPMYFAPEVAARFHDADCDLPLSDRADVFAMALSLVHCIYPPAANELEGIEFEDFVRQRAAAVPEFPSLPELAPYRDTLERWLSFDSLKRPSAEELADELFVLASGGIGKPSKLNLRNKASSSDGTVARSRRRGWFVGFGLVALGALVGGVAAWSWAQHEETQGHADQARATDLEHRLQVSETQLESVRERTHQLENELSDARTSETVSPPSPASTE